MNTNNIYALLAGVGERKGIDSEYMAISADDATILSEQIQERCKVLTENMQCVTNTQTTKQSFLSELDKLIAKTEVQKADLVILFFSGHGCKRGNKYYLVCNDSKNNDIENTALEGSVFLEKLQSIKTEKMLVLLDCCHSGGFADMAHIPFEKNSFLRNKNRVILTASHAEQRAYLSKPVSMFTYSIIEAIAGEDLKGNDKEVRVLGLSMYVRESVVARSKRKQQPQLDVLEESQTSNFVIVHYPNGKPDDFGMLIELLDEKGEKIIGDERVEDKQERAKFQWMENNISNVKVTGDGNIVFSNINGGNYTINLNISSSDIVQRFQDEKDTMKIVLELLRRFQIPETKKTTDNIQFVKHSLEVDNETLTELMSKAFDFDGLNDFCFRYFPHIYDDIANLEFRPKIRKIILLLDHELKRPELLLRIKERRRAMYDRYIKE